VKKLRYPWILYLSNKNKRKIPIYYARIINFYKNLILTPYIIPYFCHLRRLLLVIKYQGDHI